jgi:hypothetical protein
LFDFGLWHKGFSLWRWHSFSARPAPEKNGVNAFYVGLWLELHLTVALCRLSFHKQ